MNKKGFTLVEILAVIVILSLVVTITATKGFGAFGNAKKAITRQNIKAIEEAGKVFLTEIEYCEEDSDILGKINNNFQINGVKIDTNGDGITCDELKKYASNKKKLVGSNKETCINIPFNFLKDENFITGNDLNDSKIYNNDSVKIDGCINFNTSEKNINIDIEDNVTKPSEPINENLLSETIKNNAKLAANENSSTKTQFRTTPISSPGKELSCEYAINDDIVGSYFGLSGHTRYYYIYASSYEFNKDTGTFKLINPKEDKYSDIINTPSKLSEFKYIVGTSSSSSSPKLSSVNTNKLQSIEKITNPSLSGYNHTPLEATGGGANKENTLSVTQDNYGESYYFRGNSIDNYLNFANMCWRIVRINGNNEVKLVLEDYKSVCTNTMSSNYYIPVNGRTSANFGYSTNTLSDNKTIYNIQLENPITDNQYSLITGLQSFQDVYLKDYLSYLTSGSWCYDTKAYSDELGTNKIDIKSLNYSSLPTNYKVFFDGNLRINKKQPSLQCSNLLNNYSNGEKMYVGALTADEIIYAGALPGYGNKNFYLMNRSTTSRSGWWTFTPSIGAFFGKNFIYSIYFVDDSRFSSMTINANLLIRPSIVLNKNILYNTGTGTKTDPYTIKLK